MRDQRSGNKTPPAKEKTSGRSGRKNIEPQTRKVAIVSPASPVPDSRSLDSAIRYLGRYGLTAFYNKPAALREGYLAGPDKIRAFDLVTVLENPGVEGVFASRGGYGSMRILPLLDLERIAKTPKYIVGFSDLTALLCHLYGRTPHWCIHAPALVSLTKRDMHPMNAELLFRILGGEQIKLDLCEAYKRPSKSVEIIRHGTCCGLLVGGNLSVLAALCGTPYFPDLKGKVLLLEEIGEAPYRIDRCLTQLMLCGHLAKVEGIIIGTLEKCNPPKQMPGSKRLDAMEVIKKCLHKLNIPILANLPFGHGRENAPLPLGSLVEVITRSREVVIHIEPPDWIKNKVAILRRLS